jgi:hypothetical protein
MVRTVAGNIKTMSLGSRGVTKVVTDGHILHQLAKALWGETIKQRKQSDCSMLSTNLSNE